MGFQPRGQSGDVAFWQQGEDLVGLGLDDDGSVDMAAPQREVADADRPWLWGGRTGQVHHSAQERGAAGGDAHELSETGAGSAGQGQTERTHGLSQPFGDPAVAAGQSRHLLHERPPTA